MQKAATLRNEQNIFKLVLKPWRFTFFVLYRNAFVPTLVSAPFLPVVRGKASSRELA